MPTPPSSEILYLRHSKARVLFPSNKRFIVGFDGETPKFSRPMDDIRDVLVPNAKKLRNM